ncbi:Ger(x)C family spore germination protein [Paenibacillus glycanilyticus]|uniref:Ger(x)C family spore germination protein n=1 Tax=Paenibacillus glycanilyticus TaxID=126569 RepID=UPI0020413AE1|nr:Ger(x)C family spore germination protein [Paenibacillus glycanilyticus]MCM3628591.1 Ger(x)C family spore germination protein [Paenibacillus glycanilyticus]
MRFMRIAGVIMLCCSLTIACTGCWDQTELNRSSLVTGMALEPGDHMKYKVTFEVVNALETDPNKGGKGGTPTAVFSKEGNSIAEATQKINENLERMILISHIRVIIIDERLARKGINQFIDVLQRNRYIREDVLVLVGKGSKASDFLKTVYARGQYAGYKIQLQVETYRKVYGGIPRSHLYDVAQALLTEGRVLLLGAISITGDVEKSESLDAIKTVYPAAVVRMAGAAVFRGDKLIGFLSNEHTRMVMLASDYVNNTLFAIPGPDVNPSNPGAIAVQFYHMHSHMHVKMDGNTPKVRVVVEGDGKITSIDENIKLSTIQGFEKVEAMTRDYVNEQMLKTVSYVQKKFGVDVFGFGQHYYRYHFRKFKPFAQNWDSYFVKAEVKVDSNFTLRRPDLKTQKVMKDGIGP